MENKNDPLYKTIKTVSEYNKLVNEYRELPREIRDQYTAAVREELGELKMNDVVIQRLKDRDWSFGLRWHSTERDIVKFAFKFNEPGEERDELVKQINTNVSYFNSLEEN